MFVNKRDHSYECGVYYPGFEEDNQIYNDTFYWNKYFDVTYFLNSGEIRCYWFIWYDKSVYFNGMDIRTGLKVENFSIAAAV